jgi:hypothetical protein
MSFNGFQCLLRTGNPFAGIFGSPTPFLHEVPDLVRGTPAGVSAYSGTQPPTSSNRLLEAWNRLRTKQVVEETIACAKIGGAGITNCR